MIQIDVALNQDALDEWIEYRKLKKKALSDLALQKVINKLKRHDYDHQQYMIDTAIENDWQGLHDVEPQKEAVKETSFIDNHTNTSWADSLIGGSDE